MFEGRPLVVYISFDGILQPLAYSQVARVVAGLSERGIAYKLVSVEKASDLANAGLVAKTRAYLESSAVEWRAVGIESMGTPSRAASTVLRVLEQTAALARSNEVSLIHARAYHGAVVGRLARSLLGVPYIFDARGYWIEERSGRGQWFGSAAGYAAGKLLEQNLFRGASAVVTLTDLQATDVRAGVFGPVPPVVETIPTCADYAAFPFRTRRQLRSPRLGVPADGIQRQLADKIVLGIVGSVNRFYLVDKAIRLAQLAVERHPNFHLLVLSHQQAEYVDLLRRMEFPAERVTMAQADHDAMPAWLDWVDWGLLILEESAAKRASMPTKLAEFFASGVRPIAYGCNSEMVGWVRRAGSGYVLDAVDDDSLRAAAQAITAAPVEWAVLQRARAVTEGHFGLAGGLTRYERVVRQCARSSRRGR